MQQTIKNYKEYKDSLEDLSEKEKEEKNKLSLYIVGDQATESLKSQLEQDFQIPTTIISFDNVPQQFDIAYILAKQVLETPEETNSINILPEKVVEHYDSIANFDLAKKATIAVIILAVVTLLLNVVSFSFANISSSQAKTELASMQQNSPIASGRGEILPEQNIPLVARTAQTYNTLFPLKRTPAAFIDLLLDNIPEGITVNSLVYEAGSKTITLVGQAESRESLLFFRDVIESNPEFGRVVLPLNTLSLSTEITFTISFTAQEVELTEEVIDGN